MTRRRWLRRPRGCWTTRRRRAALSAAASEAVRAYDWPVVARDVIRVYEAVMAASGQVGVAT